MLSLATRYYNDNENCDEHDVDKDDKDHQQRAQPGHQVTMKITKTMTMLIMILTKMTMMLADLERPWSCPAMQVMPISLSESG